MRTCAHCKEEKDEGEFYPSLRYICKACSLKRTKAQRKANPERHAVNQRRYNLRRLYGISLEEYDEMLAKQGGGCAICHGPQRGRGQHFHVDHDHETGEVRGLLCSPCNTGIGQLGHDPERLIAALAYLGVKVFVQDENGVWSA